jgi:hypothetical protein
LGGCAYFGGQLIQTSLWIVFDSLMVREFMNEDSQSFLEAEVLGEFGIDVDRITDLVARNCQAVGPSGLEKFGIGIGIFELEFSVVKFVGIAARNFCEKIRFESVEASVGLLESVVDEAREILTCVKEIALAGTGHAVSDSRAQQ